MAEDGEGRSAAERICIIFGGFMVSWIRSLFCKHEWQFQKTVRIWWDPEANVIDRPYDVYICPKCLKVKKVKFI